MSKGGPVTQFLKVANWENFQHYKDRNPPWIKLHRSLLTDYKFSCLQDASKLHLTMIWLLASQMNNEIPNDPKYLKNVLNLEKEPDLNELIRNGFLLLEQVDSNTLADCKQVAMPETEAETDIKEKVSKKKNPKKSIPEDWKPDEQTATWFAEKQFGFTIQSMTEEFIDGCLANDKQYVDFNAAFRNWSNNRKKREDANPKKPTNQVRNNGARIELGSPAAIEAAFLKHFGKSAPAGKTIDECRALFWQKLKQQERVTA